ncbi:MAG: glycoside hydrolase family 3 protein [Eubacteriales bacterium]|nr:glycoside hydrolase family 3 protein [Eubacteriales bacterium]
MKQKMIKWIGVLYIAVCVLNCAAEVFAEDMAEEMSLEEKVAQMFIVLPESLVDVDIVTAAGEITEAAINEMPVGGMIFMDQNLESEDQIREMMGNLQTYSMNRIGLPLFTCVDEEGGSVARISGKFDVPCIGDMCDIGASGDVNAAFETGHIVGRYLSDLGFNVDFAPDADVLSNPDNEIVKYRSFGDDPDLVAEMAMAVVNGLQESGVCGCLKHFPGHGATEGDTHEGYAYTGKTMEEIRQCELIPFAEGAGQGVDFIMAGHISLPEILEDNTPASLSHTMITDVLRGELKYDGLVVTDALNMGAISQIYSSSSAAVQAVLAGNDLVLMPEDFEEAYNGVLQAVKAGTISEERVDESVRRIIRVKQKMMS